MVISQTTRAGILAGMAKNSPRNQINQTGKINQNGQRDQTGQKEQTGEEIRNIRQTLAGIQKEQSRSVLESSLEYRESLRDQRIKTKDSSLSVQKLKYSFKNLSSRILRSKTSQAARQAASQARREVQRLKAARMSGKYDDDEIDAAISHAKSMERIAKKKAKNLEQEELSKIALKRNMTAEEREEKEKPEASEKSSQENSQSENRHAGEAISSEPSRIKEPASSEPSRIKEPASSEQSRIKEPASSERSRIRESASLEWSHTQESVPTNQSRLVESFQASERTMTQMEMSVDLTRGISEELESLLSDFADLEEETLEDFADLEEEALEDFAEEITTEIEDDDPADLEEMKIKHRNKEMKEIVKADGEYLKATFERFDKSIDIAL